MLDSPLIFSMAVSTTVSDSLDLLWASNARICSRLCAVSTTVSDSL